MDSTITEDELARHLSETLDRVHARGERANTPERLARRERFLEAILSIVPVLPFGIAEARMHAPVWASLATSGQIIGAHDLLIAATALVQGYDVLTDNVRESGRVPGLIFRQPRWPT